MKRFLFPCLLLFAAAMTAPAADTAYNALRVFGKKEGEQALYRVIELRGKNGVPQPDTWRVLVDDPRARGGVREMEIRGGRIVGEKTPVVRDNPPVMNFNQLNLDSDGAFTVANQQAEQRGIPFDRIDYVLRSGRNGGVPEWTVDLYEGRNGKVASLRIAADSGNIVEESFNTDRRFASDRAYVEEDRRDRSSSRDRDRDRDRDRRFEDDEDDRGVRESIGNFFNRVGRHFQRRGRQLENFFTGRDR